MIEGKARRLLARENASAYEIVAELAFLVAMMARTLRMTLEDESRP